MHASMRVSFGTRIEGFNRIPFPSRVNPMRVSRETAPVRPCRPRGLVTKAVAEVAGVQSVRGCGEVLGPGFLAS